MYNRLRSSTRKKTELQSKHIKKFKFRGSETDGAGVIFSQVYYSKRSSVNSRTTSDKTLSSGIRKRKMACSSIDSTKPLNKVSKFI